MTALEEYNALRRESFYNRVMREAIWDTADAAIAELQEEAKLAWLAVEAEQSVTEKLEAEVEELANRLNKMEESYVRTINRDGEYANGLLAEVERLTWMLDELLHDHAEIIDGEWGLYDGEDEDSMKADLARRWEEHHD